MNSSESSFISRRLLSGVAKTAGALLVGAGAYAYWTVQKNRTSRRTVSSDHVPRETWESTHAAKVERVAAQLRNRTGNKPVSTRKKAVSHQVPKVGDLRRDDDKIDISDFDRILHIDPEQRICIAEPGVAFVDLVEATMRHGLVPIVVPELKTITIGGAVSGCSIESMSFVHGGFHDTCTEYEVVSAKGEVLICKPDNENAFIFQMMHSSFGTLGILTRLTFKLVPAKRYVRMVYEKYASLEEYQAAIYRHYELKDVDFMDGIVHSPTEWVLSLGTFTDTAPYVNAYDWMKVYYISTRERTEDYIEVADYFFRYDRGVTNVHPKSAVGRFFFGKFLGSSEVLWLAQHLGSLVLPKKPTVIVDIFIPFSAAKPFFEWYDKEFNFYPLWCVPYKRVRDYEWLADRVYENMRDPLFLDFAIYGMEQDGTKNYYKLMEDKLIELCGMKSLIAHNYYSVEDFWKTWNKANYERAKARMDPDNIFRDVYTKMCKAAMGVGA